MIFTPSEIDDLVIGTLEQFRPPSIRGLLGLGPNDPMPEVKPRREPKVFYPPPRRDFMDLRKKIAVLEDEIDRVRENDWEAWYEGGCDEEADEIRKLEAELSRLEHLADSVGAMSGAIRRIK